MKPAVFAIFALGALVTLGTVGWWAAAGAHLGWTKSYVTVEQTDPVTGIVYPVRVERLVPGVDILVAGVAAGTFFELLGVALLLHNRRK